MIKSYFLPTGDSPGSPPTFAAFADPVRALSPKMTALDEVMAFVSNNPHGAVLNPDMLAIDCVEPAKSRLKLYVGSPHTSFESVVAVMTLGGKITGVDEAITELAELFHKVLGLKHDFPWQEDLSVQDPFDPGLAHPFDLYSNMVYYFDIAPGASMPDVKLYIPVIRYGKSDNEVATGLEQFLVSRDREQYFDGFRRMVEKLEAGHTPVSGHRVQTFIACAFQKGSLSLTSYMNPGIYHAHLKRQ